MEGNGTNQLLGKLLERTDNLLSDVKEIKDELAGNATTLRGELAAIAIRTEARLCALELKAAEAQGGTRMLMLFGGAAATIGGIVSHLVGKIWS